MTLAAEKQLEHIGETQGCANHDYDLVQELSRRLDFLWHCDQFIANADGHDDLQALWRNLKSQEQENVKQMKRLVSQEIFKDCF